MHRRRDRGHAGPEACRPASGRRHGLLLGSRGGLPHHGGSLPPQVASGYTPLCPRYPLIRRWSGRPNGETTNASLAAVARDSHDHVVHRAAHGVLRGQRPKPAPVALAATAGILAPPQPCRAVDSGPGVETPSAHLAWPKEANDGFLVDLALGVAGEGSLSAQIGRGEAAVEAYRA